MICDIHVFTHDAFVDNTNLLLMSSLTGITERPFNLNQAITPDYSISINKIYYRQFSLQNDATRTLVSSLWLHIM